MEQRAAASFVSPGCVREYPRAANKCSTGGTKWCRRREEAKRRRADPAKGGPPAGNHKLRRQCPRWGPAAPVRRSDPPGALRLGAGTLLEVTQARATQVQAASQLVSARYNLVLQRTLIAYHVGDLDPENAALS